MSRYSKSRAAGWALTALFLLVLAGCAPKQPADQRGAPSSDAPKQSPGVSRAKPKELSRVEAIGLANLERGQLEQLERQARTLTVADAVAVSGTIDSQIEAAKGPQTDEQLKPIIVPPVPARVREEMAQRRRELKELRERVIAQQKRVAEAEAVVISIEQSMESRSNDSPRSAVKQAPSK
jgi:hypothetical protein